MLFRSIMIKYVSKVDLLKEDLSSYKLIINVSGEFLKVDHSNYVWLPLVDTGTNRRLSIINILAAFSLIQNYKPEEVLIHCIYGRNRSRFISECYNLVTSGSTIDKVVSWIDSGTLYPITNADQLKDLLLKCGSTEEDLLSELLINLKPI